MILHRLGAALATVLCAGVIATPDAWAEGYFRHPALAGDLAVFTAEGDLWSVPATGGRASRLTTHAAQETNAVASPDRTSLAFAASYHGPREVYVMPLTGGLPRRVSFEGGSAVPVGWTAAGEVLYVTQRSTGPSPQPVVVVVDPSTLRRRTLPLADVSDAAISPDGRSLFFTRFGLALTGDNVRGYRGGMLSRLWRFELAEGEGGAREARPLAVGDGAERFNDRRPMPWGDRLYFISDRDGHDNLWSMTLDGGDLRQLTRHATFSVRGASLERGRIIYQLGADLHVNDIAAGTDTRLAIDLPSDFDQERRRLVRRPLDYFEGAAFAPNGERVAVTARGRIALMGVGPLRRVDVATPLTARASDTAISPDGRQVYAIVEDGSAARADAAAPQVWRFAADGSADGRQLTSDDAGHRRGLWLSPDGKQLAHATSSGKLFLLDIDRGDNRLIDTAEGVDLEDVVWSSDSRYMSFARSDSRLDRRQILLYEPASGRKATLTSDRFHSHAPAFTPDGRWLYFLSDRELRSVVTSPWGDRNMGPYFDRRTRIYALALQPGTRFPFQARDELAPAEPAADRRPDEGRPRTAPVEWAGLAERLHEVPIAAGNYRGLETDGKLLYFLDESPGSGGRRTLKTLKIERNQQPQDFLGDVRQFALSADGKKLFIRRFAESRVGDMYIVPSGPRPPDRLAGAPAELGRVKGELGRTSGEVARVLEALDGSLVRASDWTITIDPKAEWRQMFANAWRLHRDYFYDRDMRGVDWPKIREKYRPLVERVTDREELNDILAQMMGELGALHSQIRPGELRSVDDAARPGFLGAVLAAEPGGARIVHIYRSYPELPGERSPLAQPGVDAREGDLIVAVNGRPVSEAADIAELLAGQAGEQALLTLKRRSPDAAASAAEREVKTVVRVVDAVRNGELRYGDWEEGRRAVVEAVGGGRIGYLHLRAMGPADIAVFARELYAQLDREALIIDVRRNNGGNIDSWIIEKLLRRAWAFWRPRYGTRSDYNMQQSFRGPLAVLIDERTYSDGETFAAGVKRLGLGPLIGMRTAGAGVWLNDTNTRLSDFGNARTAQYPLFEVATGELLVENRGVEPDIVVENPPHATYGGKDAQLETAIRTLLGKLEPRREPGR